MTVFAYKWLYPNRVFINRGNHETNGELLCVLARTGMLKHGELTPADMNKVYGFEGECKAKLGEMTYKLFADVFTSCTFT